MHLSTSEIYIIPPYERYPLGCFIFYMKTFCLPCHLHSLESLLTSYLILIRLATFRVWNTILSDSYTNHAVT